PILAATQTRHDGRPRGGGVADAVALRRLIGSFGYLRNRRNVAIIASRVRAENVVSAGLLIPEPAPLPNGVAEGSRLDHDVGPESLEQLFLRQKLPRALDEIQQRVEQPWRQRDRLAV